MVEKNSLMRNSGMPNFFNPQKRTHPAVIQTMYYEKDREWDDYVYQGVHSLKKISINYDVPFSLLIARMKKGLSLHEAVTCNKDKDKDKDNYTRIEMSDVIAKMKVPISKEEVSPLKKENSKCKKGLGTYTVKVYKQGKSLPFPDKMSPLWRLALGLCPTR